MDGQIAIDHTANGMYAKGKRVYRMPKRSQEGELGGNGLRLQGSQVKYRTSVLRTACVKGPVP